MFVSDGYNGTRVAKFDKNGTLRFDFGMRGEPGKETGPGNMKECARARRSSRRYVCQLSRNNDRINTSTKGYLERRNCSFSP